MVCADFLHGGQFDFAGFSQHYVPTIRTLNSTYPFLIRGGNPRT